MRIVIVTHLPPVAETYEMLGVEVDRVLPRIKVIIGSIDPSRLDLLRKYPDVKAIEEEGVVKIL